MTGGPFALAADLVEAGALDAAAACEAAGLDPAVGIAGVLAQHKSGQAPNPQEDP